MQPFYTLVSKSLGQRNLLHCFKSLPRKIEEKYVGRPHFPGKLPMPHLTRLLKGKIGNGRGYWMAVILALHQQFDRPAIGKFVARKFIRLPDCPRQSIHKSMARPLLSSILSSKFHYA